MSITALELQGSGTDRLFGFLYRALLYLSAGVLVLYLYNAPKRLLPTRTIVRVMAIFVSTGDIRPQTQART